MRIRIPPDENLSEGLVDLALAAGWSPDDFALTTPDHFNRRRDLLFESLADVRKLWCGESVTVVRPDGQNATVRVYPRPLQPHLNCWINTSSNVPDTRIRAAQTGENILTALLLQSPEELSRHIEDYAGALRRQGFDLRSREITLMQHTFVGRDDDTVRHLVRPALLRYLRCHIDHLCGTLDDTFRLTADDREALAERSFERYFEDSGLLGSPDKCERMIRRMESIGVTEIACLIDFGLERQRVWKGFTRCVSSMCAFAKHPKA